jgi:hypothetical protein
VTLDARETDLVSSLIGSDDLAITVKAPGGLDTYAYDALPSEGRDAKFRIDIASTDGWGEIVLIVAAVGAEPEWTFSVGPVAQEWSLCRTSAATREFFNWVEPRLFANLAPGAIESVEIQVEECEDRIEQGAKCVATGPSGFATCQTGREQGGTGCVLPCPNLDPVP